MSLTNVIQTLKAHPEGHRVHKLLYWVYRGQWAETTALLQQCPIESLLPNLVRRTPSFEVLERRLYKAASVLTKPQKYRQIAALILQTCAELYPSAADQDLDLERPALATAILAAEEVEEASPITVVAQPDRFELRRLIMQQVPPLKVKILLFSVLRRPFSFGPKDWDELTTQSLDGWLSELLQRFPAVDVIETQLFAQAAELPALDQGTQVAEAIVHTVRLQMF